MRDSDEQTGMTTNWNPLFHEDFSAGLRHEGPDAPWEVRPSGPLPHGDGVVTTGEDGLHVVPLGANSDTGAPAFVPIPPNPYGLLRWSAFLRRETPTGQPGFVAPEPGVLRLGASFAATVHGRDAHPFDDVTDATTDLRLGAAALIVLDRANRMIFDVILTNEWVLGIYERLPGPDPEDGYFSFAPPLLARVPGTFHDVAITYDREAGEVTWTIDGQAAMTVTEIGLPVLDEKHRLRSGGSRFAVVRPEQLNAGLAVFSKDTWGQGVTLRVRSVSVHQA